MSFTISRRALAGVATGAVAASAVSTIAAAKTAEEIMKDGTLRIGVHPNSPPFSWRDQAGAWSGFDVTIGQRIAEDLKLKAELVPTETAERIDFLNAGKIDISLGGLTRTPERAMQIAFTVPLHAEVMGVLTTGRLAIDRWKQLDDERFTLVDIKGAWTIDWAKQNLPKAKMETVDSPQAAIDMIASGKAQALVEMVDFFMAAAATHSDIAWKVLDDHIDVNWDCIGVAKGNVALRDVLNVVLHKLHATGFVVDAWKTAFGAEPTVKVPASPWF